jgi:hypothetical protein
MRAHLSYANVMATVAVFIALGGGAYAAGVLPVNSVGTKQLKKNAVTSAKVKDRSLTAKDFKAGQLKAGPTGPAGAAGANGAAGTPGKDGAKGDPGPTAGAYVSTGSATTTLSDNQTKTVVDLGTTGKRITTSFPAIIMATGQASVYADAADDGQVACQIVIDEGAGGALTPAGQEQWFNFPATLHYNNGYSATGGATKPAGTYNVGMQCTNAGVVPSVTVSLVSLQAWAVKAP